MRSTVVFQINKYGPCSLLPLLLFLFSSLSLWSQETSQILSVKNGLPQNSILAVEEDFFGNIWIGTEAGISRWNGSEIINYPRIGVDPFPQGYVNQIYKDYANRLWIVAGDGALYFWNEWNDRFEESGLPDENMKGDITLLHSDPIHRDLLICTSAGEVFRWDHSREYPPVLITEIEETQINLVTLIGQEILLGTEKGWVSLQERDFFKTSIPVNDPFRTLPVKDTLQLGTNLYVAHGEAGLTRYDLERQHAPVHNSSVQAFKLESDLQGNLMILESSESLVKWDKSLQSALYRWTLTKGTTEMISLSTHQILLSTSSSGLWMIDPYLLSMTTLSPGRSFDSSSDIMHLYQENSDNFWMAGYDGGLYHWNRSEEKVEHFSESGGTLPTDNLKYIQGDDLGRLWIGSYDRGVFLFNTKTKIWSFPDLPSPWNDILKDSKINQIYKDSRGLLWFCTEKGLYRINPVNGYFQSMSEEWNEPELKKTCWSILEDKEGIFWIGFDEALIRADSRGILDIPETRYEKIWYINQGSRGLIFTGSPSGLEIFNNQGKPVDQHLLETAMLGLNVYGILEDSQQAIWITTNQGAYRWNRKNEIKYLSLEDGLLSREFNLSSLGKLSDGSVYLGGIEGIHIINQQNLNTNRPEPRIFIKDININSNRIMDDSFSHDLTHPQMGFSGLKDLYLDPQENHIVFLYELIGINSRQNIQVEYRMKSLNPQWIDVTKESRINFVALPPGDHLFELRLNNGRGTLSDSTSIQIHLATPFFRSWWFFMSLFVTFVVLFLLIIRNIHTLKYEIQQRKHAEDKFKELNSTLEDQVQQRTGELQKTLENLKTAQKQVVEQEKMSSLGQVVAGVAHEINTPLGVALLSNSILQDISKRLESEIESEQLSKQGLKDYIDEMNQAQESLSYNLDRAASLVKNFKQVAIEKNQLEIIEFDLCSSIHSLLNSLYNEFKRFGVTTITHFPPQCSILSYPGDISQIITNLLMNSINHGFKPPIKRSKKLITLAISATGDEIVLRIRDNGHGIPEENLSKIFNPFFTTDRENGGTGLGLNIVYNTVKEKLGGQIKVNSTPGQGTEFIISLSKDLYQSH